MRSFIRTSFFEQTSAPASINITATSLRPFFWQAKCSGLSSSYKEPIRQLHSDKRPETRDQKKVVMRSFIRTTFFVLTSAPACINITAASVYPFWQVPWRGAQPPYKRSQSANHMRQRTRRKQGWDPLSVHHSLCWHQLLPASTSQQFPCDHSDRSCGVGYCYPTMSHFQKNLNTNLDSSHLWHPDQLASVFQIDIRWSTKMNPLNSDLFSEFNPILQI